MIGAISDERAIWNKKDGGYKNNTTKEKAWGRVTRKVKNETQWELSVGELKKKWTHLRREYRRSKLAGKAGSDDGNKSKYSDALAFLKETDEHRRIITVNMPPPPIMDTLSSKANALAERPVSRQSTVASSFEDDFDAYNDDNQSTRSTGSDAKRKRHFGSVNSTEKRMISLLEKIAGKKRVTPNMETVWFVF